MLLHFKFPNGKLVDVDVDQSISLGQLQTILRNAHLRDEPFDTNRPGEEIHITHNGEALTSYFDTLEKHSISPGDRLDVQLEPNNDLFFKTQSGRTGTLRVKFDTTTIKNVQDLIKERLSWPVEQFTLKYVPNVELEQSKTLEESGIPKAATIHACNYSIYPQTMIHGSSLTYC